MNCLRRMSGYACETTIGCRERQPIVVLSHYYCVHRAGDRARTGDVQLGKLAFYQLNYAREATLEILAVAEWGVNCQKSRRNCRAPAPRAAARSRRVFRAEA